MTHARHPEAAERPKNLFTTVILRSEATKDLLMLLIPTLLLALSCVGVAPRDAVAPVPATEENAELIAAARAIMQNVGFCVVITVDASGRPQARIVDPFLPDERMVVWFATNPKSRKVAEIKRDPRVTLHYFDRNDPAQGYVTLLGRARLVDDPAEKQKRWKDGWEEFWPNRDESYLLVEVTPERIEVSSSKYGIANDPVTWKPQSVTFRSTEEQ